MSRIKKKEYPETIIIERMYAGKYIEDNIGHEIINTFKTDNGENYIYISPWGVINSLYKNTKYVLLVRLIDQHCFEVLGYAGKLSLLLSEDALKANNQRKAGIIDSQKQTELIQDNLIQYGGVRINDLLTEQDNTVFVTFKANEYRQVKAGHKLYIVDSIDSTTAQCVYIPDTNFSKQSLHMYFDKKAKTEQFNTLNQMIENAEYWEPDNTSETIIPNEAQNDSNGILEIIGKTDDELAHSNWIAFYLRNDKALMRAFITDLLGICDINSNLKIIREYHNIDLWMENKDHIIVIENKIKSGINGVNQDRHDITKEKVQSQLSKYIKFAEKEDEESEQNREKHFYILLPDYSYKDEDLRPYLYSEQYTIIRYSALLDFFDSHDCELPYYEDFISALKKHASEYKKDLYEVMKDRFSREIISRKND